MLLSLTLRYRFVVIFLPLMNLVEVDTDLKLPVPPPPPPKDEEEKEVIPPPISPNELKPTKRACISEHLNWEASLTLNESIIYWDLHTWIKPGDAVSKRWEMPETKEWPSRPASACAPMATVTTSEEIIKGVISCRGEWQQIIYWLIF